MIHFDKDHSSGFDSSPEDKTNGAIAKILIVENEAIIAEDLRRRLEELGYNVIAVASSGRVAIDLAKQNPPDILLMDLDISGDLNGAEAAVILQGYFDRNLPVVFVTAFSEKEFPVIKALESYLYVKKPFTDEDIIQSLNKAVEITRKLENH